MNPRLFLRPVSLIVVFSAPLLLQAENEVGFIERFALAQDREKALQELVPGTPEAYYFQALHYQNSGKAKEFAAVMEQWRKRFPESPERRVIENREALLRYEAEPKRSLDYLKRHLGLHFNDVKEVRDQKPNLPSALDPNAVTYEAFLKQSLAGNSDLSGLTLAALERLVSDKATLTVSQRRSLLQKMEWPIIPGLVELIAEDLRSEQSRGFGEFTIHRQLLAAQLDALVTQIPELRESQAFVEARFQKLAPGADADVEFDLAEREAWLARLWDYAKTLSPVFNTQKAGVLYARLETGRRRGVYDKALFEEYLKLPRAASYVNARWLAQSPEANRAALDTAFPGLPAIGGDEALVRDFFLHFFAEEETWEPYKALVDEVWLKRVFAEAKIVNGVGDPERWASLISASEFQALRERVEIDFAPETPQFFAPGDAVKLRVFVKNTPKLIVRVYEINTLGFYLQEKKQLDTALDLDGLVANSESTREFSQAPLRRVEATLDVPELKGRRGAWVIELIGNGKSSRALIRKGAWNVIQETGAGGDLLTVIDENRSPVLNAAVWLDGRKFTPDAKTGKVLVPFTSEPGSEPKPVVVADAEGNFASLTAFRHSGEEYKLIPQIHIEREQLLPGKRATIAVRPILWLNQTMIAPELLEEPKLEITASTLDGITTSIEVPVSGLGSTREFTHTFTVPERLESVWVHLKGKVGKLTEGGRKEEQVGFGAVRVNGIDKTEITADGHLSRFGDDYVFELLGKNGEPLADQQVVFDFHHWEFERSVRVPLRTDENGRVLLGVLRGIGTVAVTLPSELKRSWPLSDSARTWPDLIEVPAGESISIPREKDSSASLLAIRNGLPAFDRTPSVKEAGAFWEITGLEPGDYSLRMQHVTGVRQRMIRVTRGKKVNGWILGENRQLGNGFESPLQIDGIRTDEAGLRIQLRNWNRATRVHVAATRFLPEETLFDDLGGIAHFDRWADPFAKLPNLFESGREIGDEYRYILERRYAKRFPGNMLTRPGLLLNPWDKRETGIEALSLRDIGAFTGNWAKKGGSGGSPIAAPMVARRSLGMTKTSFDFLAETAPVLYNLTPDEAGVVVVPRAALGDRQSIQVYAEDAATAVWRSFALGEQPTRFADLRLARNLDPAKAFSEAREGSVVPAGESVVVDDLTTGDLEIYDSLDRAFALLSTLAGENPDLVKFGWVIQWPKLSDEEKRAKYSEFACHELNFFLSRKDPEFFAKVVRPYLAHKKEKTFMDEFLLEAPLERYLEPWAYARLNAAEQGLLAIRLRPTAADGARHLRELWELLPPDPEREDRLFEAARLGRSLAVVERGSMREEKSKIVNSELSATESLSASLSPMAAPRADFANLKAASKDERADNGPRDELLVGSLDADASLRQRAEAAARPYYRALGPVKEWAENNYYRLPIEAQRETLVPVSAFWRDYSQWIADGAKGAFLSARFTEASRNFTEIMLALSVLDLPFEAAKHETETEGKRYTLKAGSPLIAFRQEIREMAAAKPADEKGTEPELVVSESFFRNDDRYKEEGNEKREKIVTGEFLTGVAYGGKVVVSNPAASVQKVSLLYQIPKGALPILGSKPTHSQRVRLEPYSTQTFEYFFYFPKPSADGSAFPHYPAHVARDGTPAGAARAFSFNVVERLSEVDKGSWDYVSQYGSEADVFDYLDRHNLQRIDLNRVAWRCREDVAFLRKLADWLVRRHGYSDAIYRYGVYHNDPLTIREWLRHRDDFIAQCGPWLASPLASIDPVERRTYEHLEYSPLVNPRAHRLGAEARIANPDLLQQYRRLLEILAHKPALEVEDHLAAVYYLFLQDRVEEAVARLRSTDLRAMPMKLQVDYLQAYAAFYEQKLDEARALANRYADYPVDRWRNLFAGVLSQLNEIEGKAPGRPPLEEGNREGAQEQLAAKEPGFDFKVENRTLALHWTNLSEVTVHYYRIDPEFSFSGSPFVSHDASRFAIVKAGRTDVHPLPKGKQALEIPLPKEFAKSNVLVELRAAGMRKTQVYHANTLKLQLAENYGRLEVRDSGNDRPLGAAYVKVYARLRGGAVRFFKDGYTDLRGKFDYASLNSGLGEGGSSIAAKSKESATGLNTPMIAPGELGEVERLAILVMSENNGNLVREIAPPSR